MKSQFKRVLIKISGEALAGESGNGYDREVLDVVANQIKQVVAAGIETAVVVGGGNFWRGRQGLDMNRSTADYMGMLATIMNALCLSDCLESNGVKTAVLSSLPIDHVVDGFERKKAASLLKEGKVLIFGGGTGSPYFSTDTTASLRAAEIGADVILLAKNVDGIYDSDPKTNKNAKKYQTLSYLDFINQGLKAMDTTAVTMCMENNIAVYAFLLNDENSIVKALSGDFSKGTWIK